MPFFKTGKEMRERLNENYETEGLSGPDARS